MVWDRPNPYIVTIEVEAADIDELGHVNNAAYVRWLERCAWHHSGQLGLGLAEYKALDRAMVVLRHEIDYLQAAYKGDEIEVGTWLVSSDGRLRLAREFQIVRKADQATLLRARSTFVCIELSNGKARRMPPGFVEIYGRAVAESLHQDYQGPQGQS
jgi:acyl-CoA thioester hydrolase